MSKIKTILSIIFIFTIWGCVSSAYPILLWWSRECVLYLIIIIKPEVWIINHCLGLGHETMVCAVCLTMFLWGLCNIGYSRWRHQMERFSALLALCARNSTVTGEFPSQRPILLSFDIFFDLRLNKRLSKQSWDWWFETPSRLLWRHCNASEMHLSLTSFTHNVLLRCQIDLRIYKEHDSVIAVICRNVLSDLTTKMYVLNEGAFAKFLVKMRFGRPSYISQAGWSQT